MTPLTGVPAPPRPRREGLDRLLTVPNILSLSRIALAGLYLYLLFGPDLRVAATFALAAGGITDFLDGYIARRFDQVTRFGTALDPTADRLLLASAIGSMIAYGAIPIWLAVVVLLRELSVASAVIYLDRCGAPRLEVAYVGKVAAAGFMIGFPLLLLGHGGGGWTHPLTIATLWALLPAIALSYLSSLSYLRPAHAAFMVRKRANEAP